MRAFAVFSVRQPESGLMMAVSELKLELLTDEPEITLIKKMAKYGEEITYAASERAPHRIARYAHEIASDFHSFYNHAGSWAGYRLGAGTSGTCRCRAR